ncbi:hypothetical protein [Jiella sonneratiae]|uniref:Uncharacterized protein n=1 Tax=Jiella sonneratiae TaxID=2816856 RepID=A0ABS3J3D7_9HYPH|nr:hypothetical protein [Jiella sonneratiae]MBO0904185.1 hypothetical protein [Jiella sonneratiae]
MPIEAGKVQKGLRMGGVAHPSCPDIRRRQTMTSMPAIHRAIDLPELGRRDDRQPAIGRAAAP